MPDPSLRYVLPGDAPYLANLAALWMVDPALAAQIDALPDAARYEVKPSRSGLPTLSVTDAFGQTTFLHSRYEPLDEAKKLIAEIDFSNTAAFYVHGLGLGYHLELLFEQAGDAAMFFLIEPDLVLLKTTFETRDLSRVISSRRVLFFTSADKSALLQKLTPHTALMSVGIATVLHPPSVRIAPEFHQQFEAWAGEFASFTRTSMNTLILNGRRTAENIARNIGWYVASPSIAYLKDSRRGEPAVIVSAGPSLRKNKHLLKGLESNAVIIAVQTTLKPLLEMGVEPHFVTSLDYHEICTRFYENLPPGIKTQLVAEPKATSHIFSMFPGPISLTGNDYAEKLLHEMRLDRPALQSGATVAHLAFYLAQYLGCDPIIFVGQDLGFSDGLCYAPGTSYEDVWRPELSRFCTMEMKQWDQIARDRFILRRIPDQQGRPMYTEERLFTYLQQFERDFAQSSAKIIDATEGGAAKRGSVVMPLADAIAQHCSAPLRSARSGQIDCAAGRTSEAADCLQRRRDEARQIESIARDTLPLLQRIFEEIGNQSVVNQTIAQIDALRSNMNDLGQCYELVVQLSQDTEMKRFEADRRLSAVKSDPTRRQRLQVQRDIENVRGVMNAARAFQTLMDEAIAQVRALDTAIPQREAA